MADQLPEIQQQKLATVRKFLDNMKPQLAMVVSDPRHVETITRVALTTVQRNPALLDCEPRSLMGAIMQSAQLGLEPDDVRGLAYLVPYGKRVTLVPGYRGLLYLALQTEGVQDIFATLVHEKDHFEYETGSDPRVMHRPEIREDPGAVIAGYYTIVFTSGYRRVDLMRRDELDDIKKQALANKRDKDNPDLPWNAWEEEMQRKTLLRRASKTLPQNSRLTRASELDAMANAGIPQNLEMLVDPNALAEGTATTDPALPTKAPRKSDKGKEQPASDAKPSEDTPPPAAPPPPDGSLFGQGAPNDKITAATLEKIVAKMARWDKEHGSKVAMAAMKDRYKVEAISGLTEKQAQEWHEAINASLGIPAGE